MYRNPINHRPESPWTLLNRNSVSHRLRSLGGCYFPSVLGEEDKVISNLNLVPVWDPHFRVSVSVSSLVSMRKKKQLSKARRTLPVDGAYSS
jgi:hypothetical protein